MHLYTYIYISYGYTEEKEEKEGGTQQGVREAATIEAMRRLIGHHTLITHGLNRLEAETEADGVEPPPNEGARYPIRGCSLIKKRGRACIRQTTRQPSLAV